jgi:hypothetical protein
MKSFFERLKAYIEVPQTPNMAGVIVKVMIQVLYILSIATKELNESSASELIPWRRATSLLAYLFSENFFKRLVGRKKIEDALQRLDKLAQEEAHMATVEGLKATHVVGAGAQITFI